VRDGGQLSDIMGEEWSGHDRGGIYAREKKIETMTETRGLRPREQTEGTTPTKTDRRGELRPRRQEEGTTPTKTDGGDCAHGDRRRRRWDDGPRQRVRKEVSEQVRKREAGRGHECSMVAHNL
jgi:hypothetical protein